MSTPNKDTREQVEFEDTLAHVLNAVSKGDDPLALMNLVVAAHDQAIHRAKLEARIEERHWWRKHGLVFLEAEKQLSKLRRMTWTTKPNSKGDLGAKPPAERENRTNPNIENPKQ